MEDGELNIAELREMLANKSLPWQAHRRPDERWALLDSRGSVSADVITTGDAAFIAAAVNALPGHLARIAQLKDALDRITAVLELAPASSAIPRALEIACGTVKEWRMGK